MSSFVYANYDSDTQQSSDPDKPDLVRVIKNAAGAVSLVTPDGVITTYNAQTHHVLREFTSLQGVTNAATGGTVTP